VPVDDAHLGRALEEGQIRVHFLPIVALATGTVTGVEALARWHREDDVVDAEWFLPSAVRSGLIIPLGRHVVEEACASVAEWNGRHPDRAPLRVAVNLSLDQLVAVDSVEHLAGVLAHTGLDPAQLCVEMGEDSLSDLGPALAPTLQGLKDLGVRLAVDDFGTGATSLVSLQRHPLDELKIDRSFVARMDRDESAAAIVRGLAQLARSLDLDMVAEGVERTSQEQMLWSLRCESAQGWLYAAAAEDLELVVKQADEAAATSLARRPAEHHELWTGMATAGSAARFVEAVFASAPIGMVLIDGTGRHLAVNPAAASLLDAGSEELLGRSCWESIHPADLGEDLAAMDRLVRGESTSYVLEERVVTSDGTPRWVEVTASGLTGDDLARGQSPRILRQIRSIEEARRSGEDAAALRSIISASPDALVIADANGRCTHWNRAAEDLFGWSEDEMLGGPVARLVQPADQLAFARVMAGAAAGAATRWQDATWVSSSGGLRAVDVTVGPLRDAAADVVGVIAIARDVTEQRAAHTDLREAHEALEIHAGEVMAANDRLATFASTLTHDLLQPVAALDGFLKLLERHAPELDEEHRDWLDRAVRSKDRLTQAIHSLHRAATEKDLPLAPVALGPLVAEVLEDAGGAIDGADIASAGLPIVLADRGLLVQVLANLVQNSVRYRAADRPLRMAVEARRDGLAWVVTVTDTGLGIDPDELSAVFERGARGRSAGSTVGTGTGLATARSLIRRMGGEVWAVPHSGGARICLRLQAPGRGDAAAS